MTAESIAFYVDVAIARSRATRRPGQLEVRQPGLYGLQACEEDPRVRLLVTDDRAYDGLLALGAGARAGMIKLRLRAVRRAAEDPPDGVPLKDAVTAVALAAPSQNPDELTAFLRSLPEATRLLAAVDSDGIVRATSGSQLFDRHAGVIFVDTDPAWRGQGIATAMTSQALVAARRDGARDATLDASAAGRPIYRRLGFEAVAQIYRFVAGTR